MSAPFSVQFECGKCNDSSFQRDKQPERAGERLAGWPELAGRSSRMCLHNRAARNGLRGVERVCGHLKCKLGPIAENIKGR